MAMCPAPPGTLVRVSIGPSALTILGLNVSLPSGICFLISRGDLSKLTNVITTSSLGVKRNKRVKVSLVKHSPGAYQIVFRPRAKQRTVRTRRA